MDGKLCLSALGEKEVGCALVCECVCMCVCVCVFSLECMCCTFGIQDYLGCCKLHLGQNVSFRLPWVSVLKSVYWVLTSG